ncbi:MAG: rhombosortase [Cellvibrio sp.]
MLPTFPRTLLIAIALSVLSAIFFALGDFAIAHLALEPNTVLKGEWWRLMTAHWLHFTFYHFGINVIAFVAITALFLTQESARRFTASLAIMCVLLGLALALLNPEYSPYVGLSGLLHGILVQGIITTRDYSRSIKGIALLLVGVKLGYEQSPWYSAEDLEIAVGAQIAVDAHLYGAILGLSLGTLAYVIGRSQNSFTLKRANEK